MISRTLSNGPLDLRRASQRLGGYFSTPGAGLNVEIQILPTIEATSSTVECYQPEFRRVYWKECVRRQVMELIQSVTVKVPNNARRLM